MNRAASAVTGKNPRLVIVAGPPAAGKTRLAAAVADALDLRVVSKDGIKEALMDHLGGSESVGRAAFAAQFHVPETLLKSGIGLVLEGAFFSDQEELRSVAQLGNACVLHVTAPLEVLVERYTARQQDRHPGHRGLEALSDLSARMGCGAYVPPDIGAPVLRIDNEAEFSPSVPEIIAWIDEPQVPPVRGAVRARGPMPTTGCAANSLTYAFQSSSPSPRRSRSIPRRR